MNELIICAVMAGTLDICALVLMITAYIEKKSGDKRWKKASSDVEIVDGEKVYPLECDEVLIGRHASADIRVQDMSVSRYHVILNISDKKWFITDLESKSGLYINGVPLKFAQLHDNDVIQIGKRQLIFRKRRTQYDQ